MSRMDDAGWPRQIELGRNHRAPDTGALRRAREEELARRGQWSLVRMPVTGSYWARHPVHGRWEIAARDDSEARHEWTRLMDAWGVTEHDGEVA